LVRTWGPIAQPITRRLKASRTTARNRNPARVGTYVKSASQSWLGASALKLRWTRWGTGSAWSARTVVRNDRRRWAALDAGLPHQSRHPFARAADALLPQLGVDPAAGTSARARGLVRQRSLALAEFERRYRAELEGEQAARQLQLLDRILRVSPVVLIYSAGNREHNAAVVLRKVLAERKFVSELPRGA
jgi:hypothetical protein